MNRVICCLLLAGSAGCGPVPDAPPTARDVGEVERENARLKRELEAAKAAAPDRPGADPAGPEAAAKTTLHNVEYEFLDIKRNGNEAVLRLLITCKSGTYHLMPGMRLRLTTADGKLHLTPMRSSAGVTNGTTLLEGVRREVAFDLGKVPTEIEEFATIVLPGKGGDGRAKAMDNPVVLKGKFKVER